MIKGLKRLHGNEPACRKRADSDHLKFVIHQKNDEHLKFDFTIELNGTRSWAVPDVPSMDPLEQSFAREDEVELELEKILDENPGHGLTQQIMKAWDKGNYIPIDDKGEVLSEYEAFKCLQEGVLKFFYTHQNGKIIYLCRSFDVVAHETGHSFLDILQPGWLSDGQTGGFHEAFGDLCSLFTLISMVSTRNKIERDCWYDMLEIKV